MSGVSVRGIAYSKSPYYMSISIYRSCVRLLLYDRPILRLVREAQYPPGHTILSISSKPILDAAIITSFMMFVPSDNRFPTNIYVGVRHIISLISYQAYLVLLIVPIFLPVYCIEHQWHHLRMSFSGLFLLYHPLHWHPQTGPSEWRVVPMPLSPLCLVHPQHQHLLSLAATAFRYPEVLPSVVSRTDLSRQVEVPLLFLRLPHRHYVSTIPRA